MAIEGSAVLLALGAMLCLGLSDFFNKRAMRAGVVRTEFLVVQSAFFIVTTVALLPFLGGLRPSPWLALAVIAGVVTFGSYYCVLRALKDGDATVITPIYRMSFAWAVLLAVAFLGEEIDARKLVGLALVAVALFLLTATDRRPARTPATACGADGMPVCEQPERPAIAKALALPIAFAVVALVFIGTKSFLYKVGASHDAAAASFTLVQALAFLPVAAMNARVVDGRLSATRLTLRHAPLNGVLTALASILLFLGLERGEAVIVVPISQLCFVVTALLAVPFFKERMTAWKVLGFVAAIAAVLVLSSALPFHLG
jgi:uncharacterized membrane protein